MTKEELIKQCRYYKGEERCPFKLKEGDNRPILWDSERSWVYDMLNFGKAAFKQGFEVAEYDTYKAGEGITTTLPKSLLARIFHRYAKTNYSMADAAKEFPRFYAEWYGEPAGA